MDAEDFKSEAKRFLDDGYFNSDLGDTMPLALATALCIHIIILTNEPRSQRMYVTPEVELVLGTVFVVYDPTAPGHYDAALPFNKCGDEKAKEKKTNVAVVLIVLILHESHVFLFLTTTLDASVTDNLNLAHQSVDARIVQIHMEKGGSYHQSETYTPLISNITAEQ